MHVNCVEHNLFQSSRFQNPFLKGQFFYLISVISIMFNSYIKSTHDTKTPSLIVYLHYSVNHLKHKEKEKALGLNIVKGMYIDL